MGWKEDVVEIKITLKWHWRIGALIATFFGAVLAGLITWYIPKELANERAEILAETRIDIGKVLAPALQQLVLPEDKVATVSNSELQSRYEKTASLAGIALSAQLPTDPKNLVPIENFIRTSLETRAQLPSDVLSAGLSAYIHVQGYSTFSQQWNKHPSLSLINDTFENFGKAIVVGETARNNVVVYESKILNVGSQELDWVQWIRTDFENTKIVYRGGDVYLADVTFKNCTFEFGNDPASQALLHKLQLSQSQQKPVTALYAKNQLPLSNLSLID